MTKSEKRKKLYLWCFKWGLVPYLALSVIFSITVGIPKHIEVMVLGQTVAWFFIIRPAIRKELIKQGLDPSLPNRC